jgi:predicted Zn finger-like uncharacterized protein
MMDFSCPHCTFTYQLDDDYLREYGGQTTACTQCGKDFVLPTVVAQSARVAEAPLLSYAAPRIRRPNSKVGRGAIAD